MARGICDGVPALDSPIARDERSGVGNRSSALSQLGRGTRLEDDPRERLLDVRDHLRGVGVPQPDGPAMERNSPFLISRWTPLSACVSTSSV